MKDKSVGAALVLMFLFGPLGVLYVSVLWGDIWLLVSLVVVIATLGLGYVLISPISMIWAATAASKQHSKYLAWLAGQYRQGLNIPPPPASGF